MVDIYVPNSASDFWLPTTCTEYPVEDIWRECQRRFDILRACNQSKNLQEYVKARSSAEPFWFMTNFLWVNRPELATQGYELVEAPYLNWSFHKEIVDIYLGLDGWKTKSNQLYTMAIYKSRATGASVCLLGAGFHHWLFRSNRTQYAISLKLDSVDNGSNVFDSSLFGKVRFFIDHLPSWLKPSAWQELAKIDKLKTRTLKQNFKPQTWDRVSLIINPDTGSSFIGSSTTPDATRSARGFRVLIDEANSISYLSDLMASSTRVGPVALVSSVKGKDTTFARYCLGEIAPIVERKGQDGIVVRKLHYSQKPEYNQGLAIGRQRIAELRSVDEPHIWNAEMEADFNSGETGASIWLAHFNEATNVVDQKTIDTLYLSKKVVWLEAWDLGQGKSLTTWILACYDTATAKLYIVDYYQFAKEDASEIAEKLDSLGWLQTRPTHCWCDGNTSNAPKMINGQKTNNIRTWQENLAEVGIEVDKINIRNMEKARDLVRKKLKAGELLLSPLSTKRKPPTEQNPNVPKYPSIKEAICLYSWDTPKGTTEDTVIAANIKPKKNVYSHIADAIQMLCWAVYEKRMV